MKRLYIFVIVITVFTVLMVLTESVFASRDYAESLIYNIEHKEQIDKIQYNGGMNAISRCGSAYWYRDDPKKPHDIVINRTLDEMNTILSDGGIDLRLQLIYTNKYGHEYTAPEVLCGNHSIETIGFIGSSRPIQGWHILMKAPVYVCRKCGYAFCGDLETETEPHVFRVWYFTGEESHEDGTHTFEFEANCSGCGQYAKKKVTVSCRGEEWGGHAWVDEYGEICGSD